MKFLVQGNVLGFDRAMRLPSPGPGRTIRPFGATGVGQATSLFNLQERRASAPNTNQMQNTVTRVPAGWATNPITRARIASHPGNGFGGSAS